MYLALEALLSDMIPLQKGEREVDWLRRALGEVDARGISLVQFAATKSSDPVQDVFQDIYAGTRTGVFHSKHGRPVLLPHGSSDRHGVIESLQRLSRLYLALVATHLGARSPSGALTYYGFDQMTGTVKDIALSDGVGTERMGRKVLKLPAHLDPQMTKPGLKFWFGEVPLA
ncbi:hypothetical protein B1A_18074, partial [mine drainage metagenome]